MLIYYSRVNWCFFVVFTTILTINLGPEFSLEKVILFANSRLGELSDTIGSLRYASYEDGHEEVRKKYPSLADGGMHDCSSSEDSGMASDSSEEMIARDRLGVDPSGRGHSLIKRDASDDVTRKQILLRDRLRISRPMFQKAEFLGEDFSLLSAVDEADAYTAIGVELMHLLKYVCINIIAARKICKKHDRLLSNRMLGGYYQRLAAEAKKSHSRRIGRRSNLFQVNEAQPQFGGIGGRLSNSSASSQTLGIYDTKIQQIANSETMQTVSSSLAIALADFEASQSRAVLLGLGLGSKGENKTLEKQAVVQYEVPSPRPTSRLRDAVSSQISGQCFRGDDESTVPSQEGCGDENASTSSNTSLTRLQFVVTSIFGLREAARFKSVPFEHFSSRLLMFSMGPNILADGLDGCSRETLDFLCSYNPDVTYTLDAETLYSSLKDVEWGKDGPSIGGVMVASLAAAAKGYDAATDRSRFRRHVASVLSINPQATGEENSASPSRSKEYEHILRLNTSSLILYLANYYIIVPTAHIYAASLGSRQSTAALIGAANMSSIFSLLIHSFLISKKKSFTKKRLSLADFRIPLLLSSICALAGNLLYSCSLKKKSLVMGIVGRLLVGLGSAEILNRHLLSTIIPRESINTEVASLAKSSMVTIACALALGSLGDVFVKNRIGFDFEHGSTPSLLADTVLSTTMPSPSPSDTNFTMVTISTDQPFFPPLPLDPTVLYPFGKHNLFSLESIGYAMAFAWFVHGVCVFFHDGPKSQTRESEPVYPDVLRLHTTQEEDFDSESDACEQEKRSLETTGRNVFISAQETVSHGDGTFEKLQTMSRKTVKNHSHHTYRESITNVRRLVFSNVAFPTTIAILFIAKMAMETLLSSCGTICSRYFHWSGARSGLLMGFISSMILPLNLSLAAEQNITERGIIKVALEISRYGLIFMVNYKPLFFSIMAIVNIHQPKNLSKSYYYDGEFGIVQYLLSFAIVLFSVIRLESATLTLMSKVQVAPRQMKKCSIDTSFIAIFVSKLAQLVADVLIVVSDAPIFNDILNPLCLSLIFAFTAGIHIARKHFFFLI